ncbi:MAG TPA: sigma-70 family RNA polymerase sigma factor [Prolixibacteraceae bacterium]|jgi:RNA polymerase sigma factor (sigma-70 family)|nr:sigma-70 family RNA polymerase sigma factor [Bacteroidales bacterium]HNQ38148.1 sigma-70 family RNA polymerase sigma factor [Prolixibacteraceae bacterium]HPJ77432.1 sigma-70 family RNA polymerase sigma factor [Prolixibacteraceae bacterium]HRV88912.1 sigma-70 family RNA polymerase sigma factor [Prolixibacteraceae bacterium]
MKSFTDDQILKGILRHDNLVLSYIYKQYYYKVNAFVRKNSGTEEDVSDIFQEAIIVIYRKLKENDLLFENRSFETYLFSVCRLLWLKNLRTIKTEKEKINDSLPFNEEVYDDDLNNVIEKNERYLLYQKHFRNISTDCQKILQMFFDKVPIRQIAQVMGFKSEKYVKSRKFKCKELLIERIKQDTEYKKLFEDDS